MAREDTRILRLLTVLKSNVRVRKKYSIQKGWETKSYSGTDLASVISLVYYHKV
jgi:hypothetical protein